MTDSPQPVTSPGSPSLSTLTEFLKTHSPHPSDVEQWPAEQLDACSRFGVHRWFIETGYGGYGWSGADIARGYFALAAACLTTSFVITQRVAACKRIASSSNETLKQELLPALAEGSIFATVGISHLTTSRQFVKKPVCRAVKSGREWVLDGFSPWVTGASHADVMVVGAVTPDGEQVLFAVPGTARGVDAQPPLRLVALSASQTGRVGFDNVRLSDTQRLAGPAANVLATGVGGGTGGLQTSALALGLSQAAVEYLEDQARQRDELRASAAEMRDQLDRLQEMLVQFASGDATIGAEEIRQRSNSLALRATQAAMVAAKGAGFVDGHPVGRWCREALFFLVWSCPQNVLQANLCELAGIQS